MLKFSEYHILPIVGDGCDLITGNADGGSDKQVGVTNSPQQCLELVRNNERGANAITWHSQTQKCYAEFGATRIKPDCTKCSSCIFAGILFHLDLPLVF